ncbi:MAG: hypothetical protein EOM59_02495 [Clostridia bacterium]|nr:hypothetical protein [Clostridia bacterium]
MKKILILGNGAIGSTVARCMDEEPNVEEIICAGRNPDKIDKLIKELKKGKGVQIEAHDKTRIIDVARGVDLIVNALPLEFAPNALEAALEARTNYQDFAATDVLAQNWAESIDLLYTEYNRRFAEIGKFAMIGTGSAPGLICVAARNAMRYLDSCTTICNIVYEGVEAKRFLPFWWSPITALSDMSNDAYAFEGGRLIRTKPFSRPIFRKYDYLEKEVRLVEHAHDEPLHMGMNAQAYFKGVQNVYFKYGGAGVEFSEPLYRAGLLSKEFEEIDGASVSPFNMVLRHIPAPPRHRDEIQEILEEGLVSDSGAMVVEATGIKDGKAILIETHIFAPGLVESFQKSGISAEMYLTGKGGALFTKMFVNDLYNQTGLISSDMLTEKQIDYYLECAKELGITLQIEEKSVITE